MKFNQLKTSKLGMCVWGGGRGATLMCSAFVVYMVHTRQGGGGAYLRRGLNIIEDFSNGIRC